MPQDAPRRRRSIVVVTFSATALVWACQSPSNLPRTPNTERTMTQDTLLYAGPLSDTPPAAPNDTSIRPFRIHIPDSALQDLRRRVLATRFPEQETVTDPSQGVQLATIRELARYWGTSYDWRKVESQLNALPQFVTTIDGVDIHFIHVRSKQPNALPIIITHGWPGSIIEQLKIIGPLTDPTAYGGTAEDAFDVVIPSLPGHGFSGKPTTTGWDPDPHCPCLGRADEAPRLHPLCGAGRRLGERRHRADGAAGRLRH